MLWAGLLWPGTGDGAESPYCQPAPALREQLAAIDVFGSVSCLPGQECYEERIAQARRLVEAFPDDLHAHRTLQNLLRFNARIDREAWESAKSDYAARSAAAPEDPVALYLHLRNESARDNPEGWARLRSLAPDFPFTYLGLLSLAPEDERPGLLESFLRLCPSRPGDALGFRAVVPDPELWLRLLPGMHRAVAEAPPRERLQAFPRLWSAEFSVAPPASHEEVRERLRSALSVLEEADLERDELFWTAVTEGYRMLGDPEQLARAEAGLRASSPCSMDGAQAVIEQAWGGPLSEELPEERLTEVLRASDGWLERCPDQYLYSSIRFGLVQKLAERLSDDELRAEAERHLANWAKNERLVGTARSPWFQVARLFLDAAIDVERVPVLIEREAAYLAGRRERQPIEEAPESFRGRLERSRLQQDLEIEALRAEAAIALGEAETARAGLAASELLLLELREAVGDEPFPISSLEASVWRLKGELAGLEERKLDALVFFQRALDAQPTDEMEERVAALWRELGGSDEARAAAGARRPETAVEAEELTGWSRESEPLGEFQLSDLAGRIWRLKDLAGRTVLVNVWATWCAPCRAELPYFQEVYERLAERRDVAVITLNVDHNVGLIQPYLEREGFTFPVLLGNAYVEEMGDGGLAIPQNWIVDGGGTMRRKQLGFAPQIAAEWVEQTLAEVEAVIFGPEEADPEPGG